MLDEVSHFVGFRLIPCILVVSGVDDENITRFDLHLFGDHLRGVEVVIAGFVGDIHHDARSHPFIHGNLADGAPAGVKMYFSVHMGAHVVAGGDDLAVGTLPHVCAGDPFEILNAEGDVTGPRRGMDAERLRQIIHFYVVHEFEKFRCVHGHLHKRYKIRTPESVGRRLNYLFSSSFRARPSTAFRNGSMGARSTPAPTCPIPGFL